MQRLFVIAALVAIVGLAAAQTQDTTTLPQDTADDIHLLLDRTPCALCSYCVSYNIPMFGPLNMNVTFKSDTKLSIVTNFFSRSATCDGILYNVENVNGQKELVIPKQSTDCVGLLVLSYAEPVSLKLGLDRHERDGIRRWLTTFDQCAGNISP